MATDTFQRLEAAIMEIVRLADEVGGPHFEAVEICLPRKVFDAIYAAEHGEPSAYAVAANGSRSSRDAMTICGAAVSGWEIDEAAP